MKRTAKFYLMALAALVSCAREAPETAFKMVDVTFSVSTDGVRSTLSDHAVLFTDGEDQVGIYDNIQGFLNTPRTVSGNSIDAQVTEGAAHFYSLYPYDAASSISGSTLSTALPAVQEATPGSFDPAANLSIAYTTIEEMSLNFKNVGALVQFTLDEDDVRSITFMGNNGERIAGKVSIDYNGGTPTVTASDISVTMKHADGTVMARGDTYYFVVAPVTFSRGITFVINKTDGTFATRATRTSVTFDRNRFVKLGTMSGLSFDNDLYAAFTAGATIEIAGIAYNKADFSGSGEIQALDSDADSELGAAISGKQRIVFLSGSAKFTNSSTVYVQKTVVLVKRYPSSPEAVVLSPGANTALQGGSLVMKGVSLDNTTYNNYYCNNQGYDGDFGSLHFDSCSLTLAKPLYYMNKPAFGINSLRFVNCSINLKANLQVINAAATTAMDAYKDIVFENNVVYSSAVRNAQILNYANAASQTNASADVWTGKESIRNNIFYNITSTNGLFRHFKLTLLEVGGNIYNPASSNAASKTYYLFSDTQDKAVIHNYGDVVYGLGGTATWIYSGNGYGQPAGVANALSNEAEDPFESFDTTTGAYTLKAAYKTYGPQNK
ncbi:MAG: hypothetical protein IJS62_03295 [Bacteroidales bacterium]|nr:hypothetical protein [Bacteroidales bacterium]